MKYKSRGGDVSLRPQHWGDGGCGRRGGGGEELMSTRPALATQKDSVSEKKTRGQDEQPITGKFLDIKSLHRR